MFSDQDFRTLFEDAPIGLAVCTMEGKLLGVNQAYADILNRSIEETLKLEYWHITPEDYAQQEEQQLEELKRTGKYGPYEKHYIRKVSENEKDNLLVPVRLNGCRIQLNGQDCIWSAVERLEMPIHSVRLIKEAPVGLALCRMNGKLVAVNQAYADLIGRTIEETLKLGYWEITPRYFEQREQEQLQELETTKSYGLVTPYSKKYIHKDGHLVDVYLFGKLLQINGENFIWSVVQKGEYAEEEIQEHARSPMKPPDEMIYTVSDRPIKPPPDHD